MPLTNAGTNLLAQAIEGGTYTPYNATHAYIGIGDSLNAFSKTNTDLQASTNKTYKPMDATFPQVSGNIMTFQATFGTGDANYAWNEWALFNAASGGVMLNRKVGALGTKTSSQTWVMVGILTVNNP